MTKNEALNLKKGQKVIYECKLFTVENVKNVAREDCVEMKLKRGKDVIYELNPKYVIFYGEKEKGE